jgi:hypothetical protein
MLTRSRTVIFAVLVGLAMPGAARAGTGDGLPPGGAVGYQYVESIPTARGPRPDPPVANRPSRDGGAISQATRRSLLGAGRSGRAAYAAAVTIAPQSKRRTRGSGRVAQARGAPAGDGSSSPRSAGVLSVPSGTGRGVAVLSAVLGIGSGGSVIVLILLLAIAAGAAAMRFGRRSSGDSR